MIKSANKIWEEIGVVNNIKFEFNKIGNDIPILIARDYLKFPDKVRDFFNNGMWWENDSLNDVRPGKSFLIHQDLVEWFNMPFAKSFSAIFGLNYIKTDVAFGNNFNGNMPLRDVRSAFPHVDLLGGAGVSIHDQYISSPHVAFNINLTESVHPVATGFWSFNNIKSLLDCSYNDQRENNAFFKNLSMDETGIDWFQIKDYGPWKLEGIHEMMYNSIAAYPTHFFHSPYIEPEWFTDTDRITISSFLNTSPENLDFEEKNIDDISYAWEFFHLDKIHNYHPKKTVPN